MLAIGVAPAAVEADFKASGLGHVADFDTGGQPADPVDIGLQHVEGAVLDHLLVGVVRVEVFAAGQRLPGQALFEFDVAFDVFGDQALLQPAQLVGSEALG